MTKVFEPSEIYKNLSLEDMPGEVWKDVIDYNGLYQISNLGRVKSMSRTKNGRANSRVPIAAKILKSCILSSGYLIIGLSKGFGVKSYRVNRLVAIHFLYNHENKLEVNHIDGVKTNNCTNNLEWATSKENQQHAIKNGLHRPKGAENGRAKLDLEKVVKIRTLNNLGVGYKELGIEFGVTSSNIRQICKQKTWVDA